MKRRRKNRAERSRERSEAVKQIRYYFSVFGFSRFPHFFLFFFFFLYICTRIYWCVGILSSCTRRRENSNLSLLVYTPHFLRDFSIVYIIFRISSDLRFPFLCQSAWDRRANVERWFQILPGAVVTNWFT